MSFTYENSGFGLKNINMKIPEGKKIAIVGENGGGKTTLTKLLLRLYDPDSGSILIDGKPLTEIALRHYRNNVGILKTEEQYLSHIDCPQYSLLTRLQFFRTEQLLSTEHIQTCMLKMVLTKKCSIFRRNFI